MASVEITRAQAKQRLERMTAASCEPVLSDDHIEDLIDMAKRPDQYGVAPSNSSWTPTFELNAGAAEGWRLKAALSAVSTDFTVDGASYSESQIFKHCEKMAAYYEARIVTRSGNHFEYDNVIGNL